MNASREPAVVSREAGKFGAGCVDAKVTRLRDYLSRRGREASGDAPPGARIRGVDAAPCDRELRTAPLAPQRNLLLAALDAADCARLLPHLEPVALPLGTVICETCARSDYAYFPTAGIVSLLYELANGTSVEVAATGNDGMVGTTVFMGGSATTCRAVVRNRGQGYRIPGRVLSDEFEANPSLRRLLLRYAQSLTSQIAQTAVCLGRHRLEQQICRMLLVSVDRLASADVDLTQNTIAGLFGVRRETVTTAVGRLQAAGLIRCRRGRITVLDRAQLEAQVCECYAAAKAGLDRRDPRLPHAVQAPAVDGHVHSNRGAASSARAALGRFPSNHCRMHGATVSARGCSAVPAMVEE
jgi:CRP-like cAMP-binding protein